MFATHGFVATVVRHSLVTFAILATVLVVPTLAQTPTLPAGMTSVRGRIFDADTGQQITQELNIEATKVDGGFGTNSRRMDITGEFVVSDLQPGSYQLTIREKGKAFPILAKRDVQVTGLTPLTHTDIYLRLPGEIDIVIVDSNGEPVQGSRVMLVSPQYLYGHPVYTFKQQKKTDDRGRVNISEGGELDHPSSYFLLVLPPEADKAAASGTLSLEAVWYPGRPGVLQPFTFRSAERKRVDFVMKKTETHCVDGRLTADGQPAALDFEVAIPEVAGYYGLTGTTQGVISTGASDASGHFQVCGLWPGEFLLAAGLNKEFYGHTTISVVDKDVRSVTVNAHSPVSLTAEIHWDSLQMPEQRYRLQFTSFSRAPFRKKPNQTGESVDVAVPSQFTFFLPAFTDYVVGGGVIPMQIASGAYIKDVTCGGTISRNFLKLEDADCRLQITIGTDMGKLAATIVDRDNHTDSDSSVCVSSSSAVTREEIVSTGNCSAIDAETGSTSMSLRPGKYVAVATPPATPDWIDYFLTNRGKGEFFEILARSTDRLMLKSPKGR